MAKKKTTKNTPKKPKPETVELRVSFELPFDLTKTEAKALIKNALLNNCCLTDCRVKVQFI